jgi:hypothetical protein
MQPRLVRLVGSKRGVREGTDDMPCDEWSNRVERYRNAVRAYYEAVFGLSCVPGSEFNLAWQLADRARKSCDGARAALLAHEHDHACLLPVAAGHQIPGMATEDFILGDQGQSGG